MSDKVEAVVDYAKALYRGIREDDDLSLNIDVQTAIKRKDWSIVSVCLEDCPEKLSRETFKALAGAFDEMSMQSIHNHRNPRGAPKKRQRDERIMQEFRDMLAMPPKANTSFSQHKAQAKLAVTHKYKVSGRAFDKLLERYEKEEARTAHFLTEGVDVCIMNSMKETLDTALELEGFTPGSGSRLVTELERYSEIWERKNRSTGKK